MVYRPPSNTVAQDDDLTNAILTFCNGKEIVLMGDFNLPTLKWDGDIFRSSSSDLRFLDCFTNLGLTQWVKQPTFLSSGNILDIVLTSEEDRIDNVEVLPPFPKCGHSLFASVIFFRIYL